MILDRNSLTYHPFSDPRGNSGMSGKLYIAETQDGTKYLVKSKPVDVANEFVAHNLAKLIGVPTSDAVLIRSGNTVHVGIVYEPDFRRVSMNEFVGTAESFAEAKESDAPPVYFNGKPLKISIPTAGKYPDDDPLLAELMAYLAFRTLIVLEDHVQLALVGSHLISFDYAESFYLTDQAFNRLLKGTGLSNSVALFASHLSLESGYKTAIEVLRRPDTEFLLDSYLAPVFAFQNADFQLFFGDLDAAFPPLVSAFYEACFEMVRRTIKKLGD